MAQWGQGQPGYQYPMQTGFAPQNASFQQLPPGGFAPQPTGFPGQQRPSGFQQPQQTGYPGTPGGIMPQQTGFPGGLGFNQQRPPVPPVPPMPTQFQQQPPPPPPPPPQQSGFLGVGQQPSRFLSPSPGGLLPQQTGFPGTGGMQPLVPQATGFMDPRLTMMSNTFLPANPSAPYNPAGAPQLMQPQLQLGGLSLQQSFQQHNQEVKGTSAPRVPWTLSKAEKKSYDQIFRAWDASGSGFIDGKTAIEVFGQSGLDRNDLARVWTLADGDNRGKLNMAEFHVAMALIYRKLNGNDIPDELPPELKPPSHKDLDNSVDFVKGLLKNDVRARSPSALDVPISRLKERSFNSTGAPGAGGRQDATVYKHLDAEPPGGYYTPPSRHVDRAAVMTDRERASPTGDLSDMKRQLENTAKMLDRTATDSAHRTAEDEALEREMEDLRYRVKRVQEDLDYVNRPSGPRGVRADEERRRLERELLSLLHERVPEVERRIEEREKKREREKREWERERDRRNDRFGRFDDNDRDRDLGREREYRSYSRNEDRSYSRNEDRSYSRNEDRSYSRNEDRYDRDRSYRDRSPPRDRDYTRDRNYDRDARARSPPPPPPAASTNSIAQPPPPPPAPTASPLPATKNMSPEERQAFIKAEAQRRMAERMAALGVAPPPSAAGAKLDTSVEDRLAREKREAEEKAREAERAAEARERARRERLDGEKALSQGRKTPTPTAAPAAPTPPVPTPTARAVPPPPKPRAPAPPPPRKAAMTRAPVAPRAPAPPAATPPAPTPPVAAVRPPPPAPSAPAIDPEEERFRAREEALKKQREERMERLRRMEQEEEEERLQEQEAARKAGEEEQRRQQEEEQLRQKDEERRQKEEEQRRQKDEERRQKDEERRQKDEEERRRREEREARIRKMEQEEEEEARRAEEEFRRRKEMRRAATPSPATPAPPPLAATVPPPPPPAFPAPTPPARPATATPAPPAPVVSAPPAPATPAPPAPPAAPPAPVAVSPPAVVKSTNPFNRFTSGSAAPSPGVVVSPPVPPANGGTNPFFRSASAVPAPPKSPGPGGKASYNTVPGDSEEEWADVEEKDDEDTSEDELDSSRDTRNRLAQQLFGSILPPARPQSAAAGGAGINTPKPSSPSVPSVPTPPPPPPSAPPATFAAPVAAAGGVPPPPPPPPAPGAPPPPVVIAAPAPTGDRGALLNAIQGGARLRKAVTKDRSQAAVSGRVIGDISPPAHINAAAPAPSERDDEPFVSAPVASPSSFVPPPPPDMGDVNKSLNRQSVGWVEGLASDFGASREPSGLSAMMEEDETEGNGHADPGSGASAVPNIHVQGAEESDPLDDVDKSVEHRVRSLYAYEGQRAEELSFGENLVLTAHPSKSGSDWWYGTLVRDGKSGFFPKTYVQNLEAVKAKALYAYTGEGSDQLPFAPDDILSIVDRSESDWWKAEKEGVVFIVPAAYLEVEG